MTPQAVLATPNTHATFMVWVFKTDSDAKQAFDDVCALVANLNHSAAVRYPNDNASITIGISHNAWLHLDLPKPLPRELVEFQAIEGSKHTAVATPGDLHFHIRGSQSFCIDCAQYISDSLNASATCIEEVHGFRYHDGRSIMGFVDGTENPEGDERAEFALVGEEDPEYQGGSYLFVQKYRHNLEAWRKLPVEEQEKVFGRSKTDDIEMPDGVKPDNAHSALANVGDDRKVVRDNLPFGSVANNDMGTYFIAYARYFETVTMMLENMFIGSPKGNYDRLLDFSTAETGTLFFVPSQDLLDEISG